MKNLDLLATDMRMRHLEVDPQSLVGLSDDYSSGQHLDCKIMETLTRATHLSHSQNPDHKI